MNLPSVLDFLTSHEAKSFEFVKPTIGLELKDPFDGSSRPGPHVMGMRFLSLEGGTVVPVHMHAKKEKIYVFLSWPAPTVVVIINGKPFAHVLTMGQPCCVPAGTPHFVKHMFGLSCKIAVIASTQDGEDITWEADADKLLAKNR